jgi:ABC-type lipoprotein release transport system permease subunit
VIIAAPLVYYLGSVGIDIGQFMPEEFPAPFGELFYADFKARHFLLSFVSAVAATGAASFLPARRASGLRIADAMRTSR